MVPQGQFIALYEAANIRGRLYFVIGLRGRIIPIEVKSCSTGKLRSLHQFMGMKQVPLVIRFDTKLPTVSQIDIVINMDKQRQQVKYTLLSLPLYLVERLDAIVGGYNA